MITLAKKMILLSMIIFSLSHINAQTTLNVKTIAISDGSQITLRWAPQDYDTWIWGNEHGYLLERMTIEQNGVALTQQERTNSYVVVAQNLKPLPENDWIPIVENDDLAGIAAAAMFGEEFEVTSPDTASIVSFYNTIQEKQNRFGYSLFAADQSFQVAQYMGLGYIDYTAARDDKYIYGITLMGPTTGKTINHGLVEIATNNAQALPVPEELTAYAADKLVSLSWSSKDLAEYYISYIIEKSTDGGFNYSQANDKPIINTSNDELNLEKTLYQDNLLDNDTEYFYRVRGKTPFGTFGPPSLPISVQGVPTPLGIRPFVLSIKEESKGNLTINWGFDENYLDKIQGFEIYRAESKEGNFELISTLLPNNNQTYIDTNPSSLNYYIVKAIDDNDYRLESFATMGQLNDETPPATPSEISCECNSNGIVTVEWAQSTSSDVMGYRVFMSNQPETEYAQVTSSWINNTSFQHPIDFNTLSENVYFKVLALDYRENYSELSQYCIAKRPDIIPPAQPHLRKADPTLSGVDLAWVLSPSSDVQGHVLERKRTDESTWHTISDVKNGIDTTFIDSTASFSHVYNYRLLAIDDANNITSSNVLTAQPIDNGIRKPVNILSYNISFQGDIIINWEYLFNNKVEDFLIYRKKNDNDLIIYKHLNPEDIITSGNLPGSFEETMLQFGFGDSNVTTGNTYEYRIIARYINGAMSELSAPIFVNM